MAKFENEGYCPNIWVPKTWGDGTDSRLNGLWSLVGQSIVYKEECNSDVCNEVFGIDIIAYDVLSAIVKKNVNADKILVHELHNGACNMQKVSDIQKILNESIKKTYCFLPSKEGFFFYYIKNQKSSVYNKVAIFCILW